MISIFIAVASVSASIKEPIQVTIDTEAARIAARAKVEFMDADPIDVTGFDRASWKLVTPQLVRSNHVYEAPDAYKYHLSASADFDQDGKMDSASFVDNGTDGGIKIVFGNIRKKSVIVIYKWRYVNGEGIFPSGKNAVMINYPETNIAFLMMRHGNFVQSIAGD